MRRYVYAEERQVSAMLAITPRHRRNLRCWLKFGVIAGY